MSCYTRLKRPGGTYFFTVRLTDRHSDLLIRQIGLLRAVTRRTRARYPFDIRAITVLPATIHTIWTLPPDDAEFARRWSMLKALFSREMPTPPNRRMSEIRRGDKAIWQRRFWDHLIRDPQDFDAHRQMIYASPVQAGLCAHPEDWPFSSLHRDLRSGLDLRSEYPVGHGAKPKAVRAARTLHHRPVLE